MVAFDFHFVESQRLRPTDDSCLAPIESHSMLSSQNLIARGHGACAVVVVVAVNDAEAETAAAAVAAAVVVVAVAVADVVSDWHAG